eukprot:CAMPEP_0181310636 /NCGR_PEP_ID=MMETSP1101-20121128/12695_1 /TAXON_ID=46948 /ORGANISM="Rhodomonas abbreviata, Strain Caron Lab Isolate" /LENGTH=43 /DNA_ID= /DNA_START= /DNA_END= /DNA_ORIENTATION=
MTHSLGCETCSSECADKQAFHHEKRPIFVKKSDCILATMDDEN